MSAGCLVQPPEIKPTEEEVRACIKDDKSLLASGEKIPIVSNACLEPLSGDRLKMPAVRGRVGETTVDVLRDTSCSGIVVNPSTTGDLNTRGPFSGQINLHILPLCNQAFLAIGGPRYCHFPREGLSNAIAFLSPCGFIQSFQDILF